MLNLFAELLNLLSEPAGTLAYNLIIAFAILGALQVLWLDKAEAERPATRRALIGLAVLLVLRFVPFFVSVIAASGLQSLSALAPVLDRGVFALSLVVILWMWVFPEASNTADIATVLAGLLTGTVTVLSGILWLSRGGGYFTYSTLGLIWNVLILLIIIAGVVLLYLRQRPGSVFGLFLFGTVLLGELVQVVLRGYESDFAVFSRLFQMAAFPMLFTLAQRFESAAPRAAALPPVEVNEALWQEHVQSAKKEFEADKNDGVRYRVPEKVFTSALELGSTAAPAEISKLVTLHIAHALVADVCLLTSPPGLDGEVVIYCGYDLIREEFLPGRSFEQRLIPGIAEAMRNGRSLQIPTSKTSNPLKDFAGILHLDSVGNFLALPVLDSENESEVLAVVMLLSPFSKYVWTAGDQNLFRKAMPKVAHLLRQSQQDMNQMGVLDDTLDQLEAAQQDNERLNQINEQLRGEIAVVQTRAQELEGQQSDGAHEEIADLQQRLEAAAETFKELKAENKALKRDLDQLSATQDEGAAPDRSDQLTGELRLAMQQVAELQAQLDDSVSPIADASNGTGAAPAMEQIDLIASIVQDLRQPMSSIIGYTDLLLSESVGILGALQRKFLDRIKASTDRMNKLVGDLIQMTALDSGNVTLNPESIEIMDVLDVAIHETSTQLREKSILLRVDVPEGLPRLLSDKDALQQIVTNLLHNAGAASPVEGEIVLHAEVLSEGDEEFMLIEVRDSGEGIPEEDLPRVFSRLYRADNPLIQGVGDTGVGLSIVKTLIDTLGGRIWVESEPGSGSTFKVMVPMEAMLIPMLEEE
jgi:signal transduction histidine kinase